MNPVWRDLFFSTQSTLVLPMMLQEKAQISPLLRGDAETARCLPVLDGKQIPIYGFEESYIGGFSRMYDRLLRDRSEQPERAREGSPDPLSPQDARAEAVKILGETDRMALRLTDGKRILLSAKQDGGYRSVPLRLRNIPDPSFWRGIAGIGYAMLKYAEACEKVQNPLP